MGRLIISCLGLLVSLVGCCKNSVPSNAQQSNQKILVPPGIVSMFGNSNFNIKIPALEVNQYEVTNASFYEFVAATGFVTTAERTSMGMVFDLKEKNWVLLKGADWKHPQGPGSSIEKKDFHPVVQISFEDACAYCNWMNMRLPYESEWEYLNDLDQNESIRFNNWQGVFPIENKQEDGFEGTAPVGSFEKGKLFYDLKGNVWEWCMDNYHQDWPNQGSLMNDSIKYKGPKSSYSPQEIYDTLKVIKGGSFLCANNYCRGYNKHARMHADPKLSYEHIGFRCVKNK